MSELQFYQRIYDIVIESVGIAGVQVLIEQFGFSDERARQWFDAMQARAKQNRALGAEMTLADWVGEPKAQRKT